MDSTSATATDYFGTYHAIVTTDARATEISPTESREFGVATLILHSDPDPVQIESFTEKQEPETWPVEKARWADKYPPRARRNASANKHWPRAMRAMGRERKYCQSADERLAT